MEKLEGLRAGLKVDVRLRLRSSMGIIIGDDFNTKSSTCGSNASDARGQALERLMVSAGFWPENVDLVRIFAVGDRSSMIDVTFARLPRGWSIHDWRVQEDIFSEYNPRYVKFTLSSASQPNHRSVLSEWVARKLNLARLEEEVKQDATVDPRRFTWDEEDADRAAEKILAYLEEMSDVAMPKLGRPLSHRSVFWWSDEIADLRRSSFASLRV